MGNYFRGRSSRKEYWIAIALIVAVSAVAGYLEINGLNTLLTVAWILVWSRRLHDFGWSSWNALFPIGISIVCVIGAFVIGGSQFGDALLASSREGAAPITEFGETVYLGTILVIILSQFAFTLWWGLRPGDEAPNRFGPPPGAVPVEVDTFS